MLISGGASFLAGPELGLLPPCLELHGGQDRGSGGRLQRAGPVWGRAATSRACTDGWSPRLGLSVPEESLHPVGVRPRKLPPLPRTSRKPDPSPLHLGLRLFWGPRYTPHGSFRALGGGGEVDS